MFWRVWLRSLAVKRPQSLLAFAALALGATVASLLLNLYGGAQRKMQSDFRSYGANVIVAPASRGTADADGSPPGRPRTGLASEATPSSTARSPGGLIDAAKAAELHSRLQSIRPDAANILAVPVLYVVASADPARASSPAPATGLVAVGADFAALRALNPAWKFTGDAAGPGVGDCVLGARAAERLGLKPGNRIRLTVGGSEVTVPEETAGRNLTCNVAGLVASGAAEDDQAFLPLEALQRLAGLAGSVSLVELRVPGTARAITTAVSDLAQAFPSLEIRPIREIVQSEGAILHTLQALVLSLAALIVGVVVLCVMATVTTIVLERSKEVAVMKALGATDRTVLGLLLTEIGALGLAGGAVGFLAGVVLARRLGLDLFGVTLDPAWWTLGPVLVSALLVAALPALVPVSMVRSIDPARSLKGE